MIIVKKNKLGLVAVQKWYPTNVKGIDCIHITMYKQVDLQTKFPLCFFKEKSYTLHSNIVVPEEEMLKKFSSTIRNEIRRAEKDGSEYTENESLENEKKSFNHKINESRLINLFLLLITIIIFYRFRIK